MRNVVFIVVALVSVGCNAPSKTITSEPVPVSTPTPAPTYQQPVAVAAPVPAPTAETNSGGWALDGSDCTEGNLRALMGKVCCKKACATGYFDHDVMLGCDMMALMALQCHNNSYAMKRVTSGAWKDVACQCD